MKNLLRSVLIAASLAFALPASATTFVSDYTDMWWNRNESGWGMNVIQHQGQLFVTLYVYGSGNQPTWFVAPDVTVSQNGQSASGTLYTATGPVFSAGSFNPASTTSLPVGTLTIAFSSSTTGTLVYTVNGATVTKSIERFPWNAESLAGKWAGGLTANGTNCSGGTNVQVVPFMFLTVTQNGAATAMQVQFQDSKTGQWQSCNFNGNYSQTGRVGNVSGTWNCSTGNTGSFTIANIFTNPSGWSGEFTGADQFCTYNGYFGGFRDVTAP